MNKRTFDAGRTNVALAAGLTGRRTVMGTGMSRRLYINLGPATMAMRQAITRRRPLMSASVSASTVATVGMAVTEDGRPRKREVMPTP